MKVTEVTDASITLEFTPEEAEFFKLVLLSYPLTLDQPKQISRFAESAEIEDANELLAISLREQTFSHKRKLEAWLKSKTVWKSRQNRFLLVVSNDDREWLLQILNDIRIGSWMKMGCPDPIEPEEPDSSTPKSTYYFYMNIAAYIQALILNPEHNQPS